MTDHPDERDAHAILEANQYLTLATADAAGRPWATPVWFARWGPRDLAFVLDDHDRRVPVDLG
jgi:predicted pyridoxine 5'-phosphate oxidase superfamily flavin-nucleotide-binding protein